MLGVLIVAIASGLAAAGLGVRYGRTTVGLWMATACGIVAFAALVFLIGSIYVLTHDDPKAPPKPLTRGRRFLRAVGFWLLTFPFSAFCLIAAGVGINDAVNASWGKAGILLIIAFVFGALGGVLVAGSGLVEQTAADLTVDEAVPATVRKSRWWRHVMWVLFVWCLFLTFAAVSFGIQGRWSDCVDISATALASWFGLLKARRGTMPDKMFSLNQ